MRKTRTDVGESRCPSRRSKEEQQPQEKGKDRLCERHPPGERNVRVTDESERFDLEKAI
jgi:hypothetical protein